MPRLTYKLRRAWALAGDRLGARMRRDFYLYLAVAFTLVACLDAFTFNVVTGMRQKAFDAMVKNRLRVAPPSPDIVIVDVDERSLAALAADYGRWPWPRQVFGEFVEKLETHQPKAIVFDILFSDPDVYNPDSDAYFDAAIAATDNTWFPMVRLDPADDRKSALRIGQIPGVRQISPASDPAATVAMILPHFPAVQASGRLGTNNIWPDADGIVRQYLPERAEHGYGLPSLPLALVRSERPELQPPAELLINWRGQPFSYQYISFAELFLDLQRERPQRPTGEFAGKTVIIGSTAPSLFDIKATAVSKQFPGVEILATVIDNLRRGDWLRVPQAPLLYLLLTLAILWATAWAFYRWGASSRLDRLYGLSQFLLIGIAYGAINLANYYLNLTGPVMFGFVYYSIARFYAFATARALDPSVVARPPEEGGARGCLMVLHFDVPTREEASLAKLAATLHQHCRQDPSTEWLTGRQTGLWRLFENTLVLCWLDAERDDGRWEAIRREAADLPGVLPEVLRQRGLADALPFDRLCISRAEGGIDRNDRRGWQTLLGRALQQTGGEERCGK